ncbi:transcriptional repressor DicA [compost metagenome]
MVILDKLSYTFVSIKFTLEDLIVKEIYFAENLTRFREAKKLTKDELAKRLGVSGSMVGLWESKKNEPRMGKVQLIADVLDVNVDELLFSQPPINYDDNISEIKQRGIKALMSIPDDELELLVALLERHANK